MYQTELILFTFEPILLFCQLIPNTFNDFFEWFDRRRKGERRDLARISQQSHLLSSCVLRGTSLLLQHLDCRLFRHRRFQQKLKSKHSM